MKEPVGPHMIGLDDAPAGPILRAGDQVVIETAVGVHLHTLVGRSLSVALVRLAPHAVAPVHRHPHEQLGVLLHGEMAVEIDGVRYEIRPGDGYIVPSDVPHGATAGPSGAVAVEAFVAPPEPASDSVEPESMDPAP